MGAFIYFPGQLSKSLAPNALLYLSVCSVGQDID
jgi:hypothetical protein